MTSGTSRKGWAFQSPITTTLPHPSEDLRTALAHFSELARQRIVAQTTQPADQGAESGQRLSELRAVLVPWQKVDVDHQRVG